MSFSSTLTLCKLLRLLSWEFALVAGCFKIPFLKKKKRGEGKRKENINPPPPPPL